MLFASSGYEAQMMLFTSCSGTVYLTNLGMQGKQNEMNDSHPSYYELLPLYENGPYFESNVHWSSLQDFICDNWSVSKVISVTGAGTCIIITNQALSQIKLTNSYFLRNKMLSFASHLISKKIFILSFIYNIKLL